MTIKASEIKTWAKSNGVPCNGDLFETKIDGINYRAEFYAEIPVGSDTPELHLAADSYIEKQIDGVWEKVDFPQTEEGDAAFNELLSKITPTLI